MTLFEICFGVITILIAIYGAVLSTFLYLRDQSAIRVKVYRGFFSGIKIREMLVIEAINAGRRPVVVSTYPTLILEGGNQMPFLETHPQIPLQLGEGETLKALAELDELVYSLRRQGQLTPIAVKFTDSAGREYKYKFKRNEWELLTKHIEIEPCSPAF